MAHLLYENMSYKLRIYTQKKKNYSNIAVVVNFTFRNLQILQIDHVVDGIFYILTNIATVGEQVILWQWNGTIKNTILLTNKNLACWITIY